MLKVKAMMLTESLHMHMQILSVHHKFFLIENENRVIEETYIEKNYMSNYHHNKSKLENKWDLVLSPNVKKTRQNLQYTDEMTGW